MRKIFSLGLLAFILTAFSAALQAGSDEADYWCAPIKTDPQYKGLYGLCNAWWTETDPEKRADILAAFEAKAGSEGPTMPGLVTNPPSATCPCWSELVLDATSDLCFNFGSANVDIEPYTGFASFLSGAVLFQQVSVGECRINDGRTAYSYKESTNPSEQKACADDIKRIIDGRVGDCP